MASEQGLNVVGWVAVALGVLLAVLVVGAIVILAVIAVVHLNRRRRE